MDKSREQGPDEAPIKPVSSLRSLFESKQTLKPAVPPPLGRSKPTLATDFDSSGTLTRGSLDLPRRKTPWPVPDKPSDAFPARTGDPTSPRQCTDGSPAIKRHVSMDSLNAPLSPPLVTVDSPKSPPKLLTSPFMSKWPNPSSRTTNSSGMAGTQQKPPPVPPHRSPKRMSTISVDQPVNGQKLVSGHSMKPPPRPPTHETIAKPTPPPINRADKPKVLNEVKPAENTASLGLVNAHRGTSVSPFSTPPSSDDDSRPFRGETPVRRRQSPPKHDPIRSITHKPQGYGHLNSKEPSHSVRPFDQITNKADARKLGFSHDLSNNNDRPEYRPGLPPRRPTEQSSPQIAPRKDAIPRLPARQIPAHPRNNSIDQNHIQQGLLPLPPQRVGRAETYSFPRASTESMRPVSRQDDSANENQADSEAYENTTAVYPDASNINRRPPHLSSTARGFETDYDARLVAVCGDIVCSTGRSTRVWDLASGETVMNLYHGEREVKITAIAFRASPKTEEEGTVLWLGTNYGDLQEVDLIAHCVSSSRSGIHERREIAFIHRHQNSMWTLDDGGRLCVWSGNSSSPPVLQNDPVTHRVPRGQAVSLIVQDDLWLANGKEIRIFRPGATPFAVLQDPLSQPSIGTITSAAIIDSQRNCCFFGHSDGKVSIYSSSEYTCLSIISVGHYKVVSLTGVGPYLWAGYNTGAIFVYDTGTQPWTIKKEWAAHHNSPVLNIVADRSSLWKSGELQVASIGTDSTVKIWDGSLQEDWIEEYMVEHDVEFCTFREISALVVTWNAGAATPTHIRQNEEDSAVFQGILQTHPPSDLIVFGFQELVDLEDKKLTAKSLFKGSKKKDSAEHEHMSRQYRAWRDFLVRSVEDSLPSDQSYQLVHTANMVGLFSCVFIKSTLRNRIRGIEATEIKRGMGGLHGNKGAIIIRFLLDDTSICLVNCHLAAGQTQTVNRNNDITAILDSTLLTPERNGVNRSKTYVCGGDGSMILDNEICILNGDLNYRIDTMGRDVVVKAIGAANYAKLLDRDQLLVSRRRNPGFRLLAFRESPIAFAPTYKYDVGTDRYDTTEKRRVPAWCDRILYRGSGKIKQLQYQRHELRVSDHRPVTGVFKMRTKQVSAEQRQDAWNRGEQKFLKMKENLAKEAKITYLRDILGVPVQEAMRLVSKT